MDLRKHILKFNDVDKMAEQILFLLIIAIVIAFKLTAFERKRIRRREYYRNEYLKSEAWQRKRYVVLRRDNWRCHYCGSRATQVHHLKYSRKNIGREPIKWLVSVCQNCHDLQHK